MGQKTNPIGLRLNIRKNWDSVWFDEKNFADKLNEDIIIRNYLSNRLQGASVSKVEISRTSRKIVVTIHTARPGIIIGKGGEEVEKLKKELRKIIDNDIQLNISEIKRPALNAELVGQNIAQQLVKKVSYTRAVKKSIQSTMSMGAEGIRVRIAGRIGGAEIAREQTFRDGRVPLHTLRADIDYATVSAITTFGIIGIKVWIYHGEIRSKVKG
ncbi:MAG: 30S ribosomal protein S3 [Candidatus Marinimicrobia bacterium]|nr:30S ribosomal protein S3 [Candidatus Neomarinimicrobiota bacterium]